MIDKQDGIAISTTELLPAAI